MIDAVYAAIMMGNNSLLKAFIRAHSNVNQPNTRGDYLLNIAARVGNLDAMYELLNAGANINSQNAGSLNTPLIEAVIGANLDAVVFLVEHGADIWINNAQHQYSQKIAQELLMSVFSVYRGLPELEKRNHDLGAILECLTDAMGHQITALRRWDKRDYYKITPFKPLTHNQ